MNQIIFQRSWNVSGKGVLLRQEKQSNNTSQDTKAGGLGVACCAEEWYRACRTGREESSPAANNGAKRCCTDWANGTGSWISTGRTGGNSSRCSSRQAHV